MDSSRKISQYGHTAWRLEDGMFPGTPLTIAQTHDGYLWIGTTNGLVRFDGVRFLPFHPPPDKHLSSQAIYALLGARDGSLWIGTGASLERWKDGDLIRYQGDGRLVAAIIEASDGTIWTARSGRSASAGGPLCRVDGSQLRCYGEADGLPKTSASQLVQGAGGELWLDSGYQLEQWRSSYSRRVSLPGVNSTQPLPRINVLMADPDGSIWVGIGRTGARGGLQHLTRGEWKPLILPGFDSSNLEVNDVMRDHAGALWIATAAQGIYRVYGDHVDNFRAANGLSGDAVNNVVEDHEGDIWCVTAKGIDKFRDVSIASFSTEQGLKSTQVDSVVAAKDGSIWAGDLSFLEHIRDGKITSIGKSQGLPGTDVASTFVDHLGHLWVGVGNALFLYSGGKFTALNKADGNPVGPVLELAEDTDGVMWGRIAGPRDTVVVRWVNMEAPTEFPVPGSPRVSALRADPSGGMWFGFSTGYVALFQKGQWQMAPFDRPLRSGGIRELAIAGDHLVIGSVATGVLGWKNWTVQTLGTQNGLPCAVTHSVVFDKEQTLWVFSECGLFSIANSELQRWWRDPKAKLTVGVLDILDGVKLGFPDFRPQDATLADGEIWFANRGAAQQFDPTHLPKNTIVPPVHIEAIIADKKDYAVRGDPHLPPLTRDLEIDYTALSFPIPQRVRFRYRLDGWDKDWQDAGTRRQAFYTNLRPATYSFHVIACNNDGLWNDTGATLSFTIYPAYYQTRWFEIICVAVFAGALWFSYILRLRQATLKIQEQLGARMEERERIARELHDTLLQGFHGLMLRFQSVVKTLPPGSATYQTMESVLDRADRVILEGRQSVRDIREEGTTGAELSEALAQCGEELASDRKTLFSLTVLGEAQPVGPVVFDESYRIAREALINAFQHANATKIEVDITYNESGLHLRIRDDGKGIDDAVLNKGRSGHWGLSGMRERAKKIGAQLDIWSQSGAGTEIELRIPAVVAYPMARRGSFWERLKGR